ncbi:MAG: ribonuclease III [Lachnospiraceae bacterium]|nr:ribonuclease III [Lachnospiraceae bacterium]
MGKKNDNKDKDIKPDTGLKAFEERIGYRFSDPALLTRAFTHSSYANEQRDAAFPDYERLEFLGDAVLEVVASDFLFHRFPDLKEGELTKKRASMVCEAALSHCAREIGVGEHLLLGHGEEASGGREREAILADVMEAVAGAIYLDGGFERSRDFILRFILENREQLQLFYDAKTILQETVQGRKLPALTYRIVGEKGPEHRRIFTCEVLIGQEKMGEGEGTSKKIAEQKAAYQAILKLNEKKDSVPCT